MDTYRVALPQPQPVTNEEEFMTNSGRKIKLDTSDVTIDDLNMGIELLGPPHDGQDMLASGLSVLSASPGEILSARERDLSNSVQAELHLSLDRLSENYDHDDIKRMQEKSNQSKRLQMNETQNHLKKPVSSRLQEATKTNQNFMQDSLDVDVTAPMFASESSAEFVDSDNEDQHTIIADSLNLASSRERKLKSLGSDNSEGSDVGSLKSQSHYIQPPPRSVGEDKYADLRYNADWKKVDSSVVEVASPVVIDFNAAPKLEDSLDQPLLSSQRGGGEILVHKKDIFSPIRSDKENESVPQLPLFSSRSISPTRLSTDPVRLQQTNAKYEEEFTKMLEAEVLNTSGQNDAKDDRILSPIHETSVTPGTEVSRKESHSVLIRKIDSQEKRLPTTNTTTPVRLGGYQLLPDRHRIPSPSRGPSSQERIPDKPPIMPKQVVGPGRYRSPETFQATQKESLTALSSSEKQRVNLAPTPPKMPKPKNIDYVELNRQRLNRKTNSAGYLDLYNKRSRQAEQVKAARSHSELKGSVSKHDYGNQVVSPGQIDENEYMAGTVEDIWSKQALRLKVAKGERVNKGKVRKSPIKQGDNFFRASPRLRSHQTNGGHTMDMQQMNGDAWYSQNQHEFVESVGLGSRLHQHNNRNHQRNPLPIPSQQVLMQANGQYEPNLEDLLMNSLTESGFKKEYFSPRYQHPAMQLQQESPMMKAFSSKFGMEYNDHPAFGRNIENSQHGDRNLHLPPQQMNINRAEVWTNQDDEPTSNFHNPKTANRKVTFLGDNEPIAIEGITDGEPFFEPSSGHVHGLNRYKIPLPPTPPSKSLSHTLGRGRRTSTGKENVAYEDYYDVRQDNYPILPPILKSHQKSSPLKLSPTNRNIETLNTMPDNTGGYLEQHEKQKRKFKYKKYTLTDYKNLKKDVKLGGLGPDLESAREKYEKAEKAKRYAEIIRKEHMTTAKVKEIPVEENEISFYDDNYHFSATMDDEQRKGMSEKRKRAIEYSKQIPRPKPKPKGNSPGVEKNTGTSMSPSLSERLPSLLPSNNQEGIDFNWGLLQVLKDRHEKEKAQVATFSGNS